MSLLVRGWRARTVRPMLVLRGEDLDGAALQGREVIVDLGTGDGRFVLREARARPEAVVVGVDALGEPMAASASRAGRKPTRGGAPNALFVTADAVSPPAVLRGSA